MGAVGDGRAGGEYRLAQSDEQEQATAFQHVVSIEFDILRMQPPPGNGMRQPPADLIDPGGQRPPQHAGFRITAAPVVHKGVVAISQISVRR